MKTILSILTIASLTFNSFAQQTYETIDINGETREYYKYLPTGYDANTEELPLLFVLHGIGGTALATSAYGMNQLADTERFIPVYLQGANNQFGQSSWNNGTGLESQAEDLAFISNLLDSINNDPNVDINMSRVYMTGISMGSIMTYNVCRYMSDRIAAVVCHIGTMSTEDLTNFTPEYPVPTLHKHGTNDGTVPYAGTALPSLSLVQETINQLKISNGFQGDSTIIPLPDNASDGITIDKIVYNCTTPLELWRMNDADHILLFEPANDTNSTEVTWEFLKQYTHPNPSTAALEEDLKTQARIYPNPVNTDINFINHGDFKSYQIIGLDGRTLVETTIPTNKIDVESLKAGTYILSLTDLNGRVSNQQFIKE
jgi:polyhydroxybutyrate depolymerase